MGTSLRTRFALGLLVAVVAAGCGRRTLIEADADLSAPDGDEDGGLSQRPCGYGPPCNPDDVGGRTCESLGLRGGGHVECDPETCNLDISACGDFLDETPPIGSGSPGGQGGGPGTGFFGSQAGTGSGLFGSQAGSGGTGSFFGGGNGGDGGSGGDGGDGGGGGNGFFGGAAGTSGFFGGNFFGGGTAGEGGGFFGGNFFGGGFFGGGAGTGGDGGDGGDEDEDEDAEGGS